MLSMVCGCCLAFVLCLAFWGTVVMLCMQNLGLFWVGLGTTIGIIVLTYVISFIYWSIDHLRCQAGIRLEIKAAEANNDAEEKERLEKRLKVESWWNVSVLALMFWIYVVVYGIGAPIYLIGIFGAWLLDKVDERLTRKTA